MEIVKCKSCGFELYRGNDLKMISRVLDEFDWRCPVCMSKLGDDVRFFVNGKYAGAIEGSKLGRQIEGATQAAKREADYSFLFNYAIPFVEAVLSSNLGDVVEIKRSDMKKYLQEKLSNVRGHDFIRFYGAVVKVFEKYGYVLKDIVRLNRTNAVYVFVRARSDS